MHAGRMIGLRPGPGAGFRPRAACWRGWRARSTRRSRCDGGEGSVTCACPLVRRIAPENPFTSTFRSWRSLRFSLRTGATAASHALEPQPRRPSLRVADDGSVRCFKTTRGTGASSGASAGRSTHHCRDARHRNGRARGRASAWRCGGLACWQYSLQQAGEQPTREAQLLANVLDGEFGRGSAAVHHELEFDVAFSRRAREQR